MRLAQIFRIQRGEGQLVALVVGLMFVASAALTIGESGIDALFFNRVGAQALPVMYLLQGTAAFLAMLALTGILGRLGPRRAYLAAPLVLAAAVLGVYRRADLAVVVVEWPGPHRVFGDLEGVRPLLSRQISSERRPSLLWVPTATSHRSLCRTARHGRGSCAALRPRS